MLLPGKQASFVQLQKKKNQTKPDLLNCPPRQAVQTSDRQQGPGFPLLSLLCLTNCSPEPALRRASNQQEVWEGREEDVQHPWLPEQSPADASRVVATAGMCSRAGERAAMTGLNLETHKKPWKASGITAGFAPRHKQVAVIESPFVTRARALRSPGRQESRTLLRSLFKNKHKTFNATIATCTMNVSPWK